MALAGPANRMTLLKLTSDMDNAMTLNALGELVALPDTFLSSGTIVWSTRGAFTGSQILSLFPATPATIQLFPTPSPTYPLMTDDPSCMFGFGERGTKSPMDLLSHSKIPTAWQYIELGLAS